MRATSPVAVALRGAVTRRVQQLPYLLRADAKPLREKLAREFPCALGRPTERRFRVTTGHGVDQRLQRLDQVRARLFETRPSASWTSNVDHVFGARAGAKLVASPADCRARHPCRPLHRRDSAFRSRHTRRRSHLRPVSILPTALYPPNRSRERVVSARGLTARRGTPPSSASPPARILVVSSWSLRPTGRRRTVRQIAGCAVVDEYVAPA